MPALTTGSPFAQQRPLLVQPEQSPTPTHPKSQRDEANIDPGGGSGPRCPSSLTRQDTVQRMTVLKPHEWHQNSNWYPSFQCSQSQGQVTQTLGVSWTDALPRETPLADCRPPPRQSFLSFRHKRRPPRK